MNPLQVLITDDTATYRMILSEVLKNIPGVTVTATANNGLKALEVLRTKPIDVALLDIEMPEMDGLETLKQIRKQFPRVKVVMVSAINRKCADITIQALQAGALDFVEKPDNANPQENMVQLEQRLKRVFRTLSGGPVLSSQPRTVSVLSSQPRTVTVPRKVPTRMDVVTIGVSTGGPNALTELVSQLPSRLGVPILVVQHMPPFFTASLANSLNQRCPLTVKEAEVGEVVQPDTIYIAPGGRHMAVARQGTQVVITLNDDAPENSCRPAADVLFRSVGQAYGRNILAVVMTGMGSDGMLGVKALKDTPNFYCLTQSEPTCVVYGMPKSVDDAGLSDERVDLKDLASRIAVLVGHHREVLTR
jgi:two-component system chemotaxis response regulator CheB